ncbi:NFX1-type zinc finger-containing protein 1 [Scaptodrosophila lebanonensis]|uniref:NFX1-type zinc finger-containing protein 1 n=1 Tax=Drosophila lebanonensis TaxID=7225 RepID=A0A6J2TPQ7_DROLE|nr:NFX1-type zinc finger-containing protein 1 [Scaptodrosophila lebanonensis]
MSDSEDDWFNKDEDEIVQGLQKQVQVKHNDETLNVDKEEHIKCSNIINQDYLNQLNLSASAVDAVQKKAGRFTAREFEKALKLSPLDMFLYFMAEDRNIFADQIATNDSQKRVMQYLDILSVLGKLELAGFDGQILSSIATQVPLLEQLKRFSVRMFAPSQKGGWDAESELMMRNMKWLLVRAHKCGLLTSQGYEFLGLLKTMLTQCRLPQILEHPLCIELAQEFKACDIVPGKQPEGCAALPIHVRAKDEIYPTREDLLRSEAEDVVNATGPVQSGDVIGYIRKQRLLLQEDFFLPLRDLVRMIRSGTEENLSELQNQGLMCRDTQIFLNPDFANAQRRGLIFVDFFSKKRQSNKRLNKLKLHFVENLKTGALLCFTSTNELENLILATVTYTEPAILREGYVGVEIVNQYNIGHIYNKPLIMFQAPAFFEPYQRVFSYLSTCSIENFPMSRYIVDGQLKTNPPAYFKSNAMYTNNGSAFTPSRLPNDMPLNGKQRVAFADALSNEFCLIQGPPGTGKTLLSVEIVKTLIENAKQIDSGPIIVLAYTNDSLDKFLLKISQYTHKILRFGSKTRQPQIAKFNVFNNVDIGLVPPRLKSVWWMVSNEYKESFQRLQELQKDFDGSEEAYQEIVASQQKLKLVAEKLNTVQVIFQFYEAKDTALIAMTTTCAARLNFLFRFLKSKIVVFEEAAEIQESHVVACLTQYTEHVIMIGDHKQLQPYTGSQANHGLNVSLFERLILAGFPVTVLNVQYRMRSCIASLLVPTFYDELVCDDTVLEYENVRMMSKNLYFVTHNESEMHLLDMSFRNNYEASQLISLASHLISGGKYKSSDIVILTPYNAQVDYIKSLLPKSMAVAVQSVDSFQGLEANIVLLSLVRSNNSGVIGFLRQPNRVCVALSRARWALYIIGDMESLKRGSKNLWTVIEKKLLSFECIGDEFPLIEVA